MQGWRTAFSDAYLPRRYASRKRKNQEKETQKETGYLDRERKEDRAQLRDEAREGGDSVTPQLETREKDTLDSYIARARED